MKKILILACLVTVLFCCGPGQDDVERFIEDGVEVVVNHLEPYQIGGVSSFKLEEIFNIDTEEREVLGLGITDIRGFEINSLGEIYILRAYKGEGDCIFKFDENGGFVKSFGSQGEGPGEFQNPMHIAVDSEDNVVIIDIGRKPLRKYDRGGIWIGDYEMSRGDAKITSGPGDNLLVQGIAFGQDNGKRTYSFSLKLLDPTLEVLQVIDEFSYSPEQIPGKFRATDPLYCWSASQNHIFLAKDGADYEIWVYDSNGSLIRKIQKEYRRIPVSEKYREKILKPFPVDTRNMFFIPEYHPPIQSLVCDDDGKLMVATFEEGTGPGEFICDIFNAGGVFIGRKSLNVFIWESHMWARMKAGMLYCLSEKESGFKALYVYQMLWE